MFPAAFHPLSAAWFTQSLGEPTRAQQEAWPAIQGGRHTLIAAPTGSGKTLAAFFVAIDRLVQLALDNRLDDSTYIVYVSPLKALSNDIHRNLEIPLAGINAMLQDHGVDPVAVRVALRTGDTSQYERQQMVRRPPHILVTTPESLYLLLTSRGGRGMLGAVDTLIVDEIHAMLGDKRGAHLALSVERLEHLVQNPLQRIGLSATQKPIDEVARYLVGRHNVHGGVQDGEPDCVITDSGHRKTLDVSLEVPQSPLTALMSNEVWEELYRRLVELVESHQTTLIFVNTRRLAERLALSLGERIGEEFISSHHGSMSKEHRHDAEQKLKAGKLRVLVATASMELGIDIGSVNLVVQFSSPKSISAFLQRVGRSGHQVGGVPKGILFPLTRDDLVECTALLDSVRRGELDTLCIPDKPLDILSQHLVAELGCREHEEDGQSLDALFNLFKRAWAYRDLARPEFDDLVTMLAEGYSSRRGRRGALLHLDRINGMARARKGARLTALTNGGAIPDMFEYQVVLDPEDTVVGSLNEDFALESLPGDIFTLGHHSWRMLRVDGLKIRVADAQGQPPTIPFWFGEGAGRSGELSGSVSRLRQTLRDLLDNSVDEAVTWLTGNIAMPVSAAEQLVHYLKAGSDALEVMPTRECIVMERFFDEVGDMHLVIHSPFGSRMNRAWGLALRKRFCRSFNFELQAAANEDSIVISLGPVHSFELKDVFHYLRSATVREVLVQALLDAPMFESRWRWNATRALAVQRNRGGKRVPPQFQRMQAEDLIAQVFPDQLACQENLTGNRDIPDHPLVRQTIHDCLTEAMDIEALETLVSSIENDGLQLVARDLREPSPFAQEIINARPYAFLDDAPFEERRTNAIRNRSWLDPGETTEFSSLDLDAIDRVREEAWPFIRSAEELHDALMVLGCMTEAEISTGPDGEDYRIYLEPLRQAGRVARAVNDIGALWIAAERQPLFDALAAGYRFEPAPELPDALLGQDWTREAALTELVRGRLECLGPVTAAQLAASLNLPQADIGYSLLALQSEGFVFKGQYTPLLPGVPVNGDEWCERRLLQRIHRYTIDAHRESIKPVSLQAYMQYLFDLHELGDPADEDALPRPANQDTLLRALERLEGISAPAAAWEGELLPGRLPGYDPAWLDSLCLSGRITWGRFVAGITPAASETGKGKRRAGPIKTTPITLYQRSNGDLWRGLQQDGRDGDNGDTAQPGSDARQVLEVLHARGASFFIDLQHDTGLLKTRLENALAELVSLGLVSSDSFSGIRALLAPGKHKAGRPGWRKPRRAVFDIEDAGRWTQTGSREPAVLDDTALDRLLAVYLARWGVISRKVLERENRSLPWRILLYRLRRMELQGLVRGGRFIAGIGGEQFALPETVKALRECHQAVQNLPPGKVSRVVINATDPLNLLGVILPGKRVANLAKNRILFENGLPVAVLDKDEVTPIRPVSNNWLQVWREILFQKRYPVRLRAYLN